MIKAKGIKKSYGDLHVIKGVDLEIERGEVVAIVGASGAGKTTLLQILGTLERADEGELLFDQEKPMLLNDRKLSAFRNKHIGFIFQFHQLLPEFTAVENVIIPALIAGVKKSDALERAQMLLEKLNISSRMGHKPSALSGGEQQRVAVARALMNQPDLILADEPSGNLDSKHAKELHELFFSLRKEFNQTIVIVTHNEELALMSDRRLTMVDGYFE
ncbi:MAG: ABC transporter ATP-binding protein [Bacteroidia bacterium]